jgi:glyoxylate reductase
MTKPKIFVTRKIPEAGLILLSEYFRLDVWQKDTPPSDDELLNKTKECFGLISLLSDRLAKDFFEKCPNLKIIANFAVGHNNIDITSANSFGIKVTNTPDVLTSATADLAIALMFACARNLSSSQANAAQGKWNTWEPMGFLGQELRAKTLGIIGMGRIGYEVAKSMRHGFGMNIIYTARSFKKKAHEQLSAKKVSLANLARDSDFISIHCPLTTETNQMVDSAFIGAMKASSILVNTARGDIIDQEVLADALEQERIFAAGLDVTSPEPLPESHRLFTLKNCLILPHIGSATYKSRNQMSIICARNIIARYLDKDLISEVCV